MQIFASSAYRKSSWPRRLVVGAVLITLGLVCADFIITYDIRRPTDGHWSESKNTARDAGFSDLVIRTGVKDTNDFILKVYFGWSQNVWIFVSKDANFKLQVQLIECDFHTQRCESRTFIPSNSEAKNFIEKFDRVALGYRLARRNGLDGRDISFERNLGDRIVSYEGNASFSSQDAQMAKIVHQFIAAHGGYQFLKPTKFGPSL